MSPLVKVFGCVDERIATYDPDFAGRRIAEELDILRGLAQVIERGN
jgi:hypothetical protein